MIEYFNILSCPFISEKGSILGQKSRTPTFIFFFFFCQHLIKSSFFLSLLTPPPSKPRACCVSLQLCTCSLFHQLMPGRIYCGQGPSVYPLQKAHLELPLLITDFHEIHKKIKSLQNTYSASNLGWNCPKGSRIIYTHTHTPYDWTPRCKNFLL